MSSSKQILYSVRRRSGHLGDLGRADDALGTDRENAVFVSRPCEAHPFMCDRCDLQALCHELFHNGETCPIFERGEVWMRLDGFTMRADEERQEVVWERREPVAAEQEQMRDESQHRPV